MLKQIKKSLHSKILIFIIGSITVGVVISIFWELKTKERELLDEKLRASRFIAQPILNAIYEDMLEERADLARHLINTLGSVQGVDMRIVRSNGMEEAFKDLKTINAVKKEHGKVRPEWLTDHPEEKNNVAKGVDTPEFKRAFASFKANWKRGAVYYIDKSGKEPLFTYLQPIEKKPKCNTCHATEGARGILMITTHLGDMYGIIEKSRNGWIISGVLAISAGGVLLSLLIKSSITGPIKKNVTVMKRIAEGRGDISERLEVASEDEMGYLAAAFNLMLDTLEKRAEENKRLFEMVEKSKEEWVTTFDAIQDLISIHGADNRVFKVNKALARKLGARPEELIGKGCTELFRRKEEPLGICGHAREFSPGAVDDIEVDDLGFEGTYRITTFPVFNEKGEIWARVHVAREITQEKLLMEQLLHSEKLSSVGKLVAGIAHELNNPLMGIMGFSQLLMDMPGDKKLDDIKDKLRKIYHESLRTSKIVQNLLSFSRSKKTEKEYIDINGVLRHTLDLREYSLKSNNIEVTLGLDEALPKTMADLYQLQQVFINIINNAEDAMVAQKGGGTLHIGSRVLNDNIQISFKDSGPGVPRDAINKVFDPFFTTKEVGKGTGLGLSISHGIITEHGGSIEICCPEEGGTLVTVSLPVIGRDQWTAVNKSARERVISHGAMSGKKALVVDDEKSVREALSDILSYEGFIVEAARDGQEALDALGRERFSLLITDIKMPGVSGIDLYNAVSVKYPYLKNRVIIVTGDVLGSDINDFLAKSRCPYILKPFEMAELLDLINKVLSA